MNFGVVERQDDAQGTDDPGRFAHTARGAIDESLVHVSLHDRQLHAGRLTQQPDIGGRSVRRHHLERDIGLRGDEFREVRADREIGAALVRGDDLVFGRALRVRRDGERGQRREDVPFHFAALLIREAHRPSAAMLCGQSLGAATG